MRLWTTIPTLGTNLWGLKLVPGAPDIQIPSGAGAGQERPEGLHPPCRDSWKGPHPYRNLAWGPGRKVLPQATPGPEPAPSWPRSYAASQGVTTSPRSSDAHFPDHKIGAERGVINSRHCTRGEWHSQTQNPGISGPRALTLTPRSAWGHPEQHETGSVPWLFAGQACDTGFPWLV